VTLNIGKDDPLWRRTAYWCVIISFFVTPLIMLAVHLLLWNDRQAIQGDFRYIGDYHKVLAALLIAMLGFNSWDRRNGNNKERAVAKSET
jgi:hypothetical protein